MERYNGGQAFKVTCRDQSGVIVTLIADNYFGYCKKEVKTQISYAANLLGNVEEEHAGGALAFASWSLGDEFQFDSQRYNGRTFADVARDYSDFVDVQEEGWGVDRKFPQLCYVPENARAPACMISPFDGRAMVKSFASQSNLIEFTWDQAATKSTWKSTQQHHRGD